MNRKHGFRLDYDTAWAGVWFRHLCWLRSRVPFRFTHSHFRSFKSNYSGQVEHKKQNYLWQTRFCLSWNCWLYHCYPVLIVSFQQRPEPWQVLHNKIPRRIDTDHKVPGQQRHYSTDLPYKSQRDKTNGSYIWKGGEMVLQFGFKEWINNSKDVMLKERDFWVSGVKEERHRITNEITFQ